MRVLAERLDLVRFISEGGLEFGPRDHVVAIARGWLTPAIDRAIAEAVQAGRVSGDYKQAVDLSWEHQLQEIYLVDETHVDDEGAPAVITDPDAVPAHVRFFICARVLWIYFEYGVPPKLFVPPAGSDDADPDADSPEVSNEGRANPQ